MASGTGGPNAHRRAARGRVATASLAFVIAFGAGGATLAGGGCGEGEFGCTQVDCGNGVTVVLGERERFQAEVRWVSLCVDGTCGKPRQTARSLGVDGRVEDPRERDVRVALELRDPDGELLGRPELVTQLRREQPNGSGCPPSATTRSFASPEARASGYCARWSLGRRRPSLSVRELVAERSARPLTAARGRNTVTP